MCHEGQQPGHHIYKVVGLARQGKEHLRPIRLDQSKRHTYAASFSFFFFSLFHRRLRYVHLWLASYFFFTLKFKKINKKPTKIYLFFFKNETFFFFLNKYICVETLCVHVKTLDYPLVYKMFLNGQRGHTGRPAAIRSELHFCLLLFFFIFYDYTLVRSSFSIGQPQKIVCSSRSFLL